MFNKGKIETSLADLFDQFKSGKLSKTDYIGQMHKKHQILFDYHDYLKSTDVESITIGPDSVSVTVRGSNIKLLLDKEDSRFIPIEMMNFKRIDVKEMDLLAKIMPERATAFDIGANIGWFTLFFATLPQVKKVYAFEPIPYTFDYLRRHLKLNRVKNAQAFNCGLGETAAKTTFYWTPEETGSASMTNIQQRSKINKVKCKITTVDKFMKNRKISLDLIKCDVEGAELFVFKGAVNTLKKYQPIIYTEMLRKWSKKFDYHPDDIINLLADLGYRCYGYIGDKIKRINRVSSELETTNFFFFHIRKHSKIIAKL